MNNQNASDNPCTHAEQLLPDYWQGDLNAGDRVWLESHLQTCGKCAELTPFWIELGELPATPVNPLQRERFDAMLAAHEADRARPPFWRSWSTWLRPQTAAVGLMLLLLGMVGGWALRGLNGSLQAQAGEIVALHEEVRATNELVVLSMLQQESANDRLAGVSYSNRITPPDLEVVHALLHSLQHDANPNVRLAALEALQRAGGTGEARPTVSRGIVDSFQYQESPLVQVALVDSLLELRAPEAQTLLRKVSADPMYSAEVRERAAWGLSHWN